MNPTNPKYSIIIPTYNGISYLPTCIETVTSQNYHDYELIISDDHSTDGTRQYLEKLNHPNIKVIYPPESLSMTEHWEWALSHAIGDWQIFVGQDDGLQNYFFHLADRLTEEANQKGLRTIASTRAYFFWKGCDHVYGGVAIGYRALNKTKLCNVATEAWKALLGIQDYFELPQMYTTSIFNRSVLNEAREKQKGKVFTCHPQDANLAAIAYSLEKYYLKSFLPFGWVGTSPKSAGMAISGASPQKDSGTKLVTEDLKRDYLKKVSKSELKYHKLAGDFSFGSIALYFWQALLMTQHLRVDQANNKIKSKLFKVVFFSSVLYNKKNPKSRKTKFNYNEFQRLLEVNGCNKYLVTSCYVLIALFAKPISFLVRVINKIKNTFTFDKINLVVTWSHDDQASIEKASIYIEGQLKARKWF